MPRAEPGSTKAIGNRIKSKGLQRLRFYCQACEKQCRDENGFKCHTQSESHVRQMQLIGQDPRKHINEFSQQFFRAFLQQLKTGHGTKQVHINHFYQEYIQDKTHIHMNATKWKSLTEFAKYLGQEGICRVEETEKGVHISWIDNSPEALRRQAAIQKQERMEKNDEEREQRMIRDQIAKAEGERLVNEDENGHTRDFEKQDGQKVSLSLGLKQAKPPSPPQSAERSGSEERNIEEYNSNARDFTPPAEDSEKNGNIKPTFKMSIGTNTTSKPKNVFAQKKTNALATKRSAPLEQPKKMSEAERIMRDEIERNKTKGIHGNPTKRQRLG